MSSILDALKKADQKAAAEKSADAPWPAPIADQRPAWQNFFRMWIPFVFVICITVAGFFYWQRGSRDSSPENASNDVEPASKQTRKSDVAANQLSKPGLPAPGVSQKVTSADYEPQTKRPPSLSKNSADIPAENQATVRSEKQGPAVNKSASGSLAAPSGSSPGYPEQTAVLETAMNIPRPPTSESAPAETKEKTNQFTVPESVPVLEKIFKNDKRIDLQALVWAPEANDRFVVINNQLIREGGSVDNIVVEKINPDDVRLSEGSDRWHEAFSVR